MTVVRVDRQLWGRMVLLTLLLTWPLILFGRPGYTDDSPSYFKGGRVAVNFAVGKIASQFHVDAVQSVAPAINDKATTVAAPADTVGVRSIPYSVAAYLLSAPDAKMMVLVLAQTFVTALIITIVALNSGRGRTLGIFNTCGDSCRHYTRGVVCRVCYARYFRGPCNLHCRFAHHPI